MRKHLLLTAICAFIALWSPQARAQGERLGAVAGTWEACEEELRPLKQRVEAAAPDPKKMSAALLTHLKHRLAVESDRCAQRGNAPLHAVTAAIQRYVALAQDDRALALSLSGMKRFGPAPQLQLLAGKMLYKKGQAARALPLLQRVVDATGDVDANQILGSYYYKQGDLRRAIAYLKVVAKERSTSFEANAGLGDACLAVGDLDCAGTFLGIASGLKAEDVLLAVKVGDLQRSRGDAAAAIEAYERALKTDDKRLDARLGLGRAFAAAGLHENAQAELLRAAEAAPTDPVPAIEASRALRVVGRPLLGVTLTERVVSSNPSAAAGQIEHLLALVAAGNRAEASARLERAPAALATDDRWLAARGDALLALGRAERALENYTQAAKLRPSTAAYLVRQARALRSLGRSPEAAALLAPHKGANSRPLHTELADALHDTVYERVRAGETKAAVELAAEAVGVAPHDPESHAVAAAVLVASDARRAARHAEQIPASPLRDAIEAWLALDAKRWADADRLAVLAHGKEPKAGLVALRAAALLGAGKAEQALAVLATSDPGDPLLAQWYGRALATSVFALLGANRHAAAVALAQEKRRDGLTPEASDWLALVPLIAKAADGSLVETDTQTFKRSEKEPGRRVEPGDLQRVLLAMTHVLAGRPEAAVELLRKAPKSASADQLVNIAMVEWAGQMFRNGRADDAAAKIRTLAGADSLPAELRFNLGLIKAAGSPEGAGKVIATFAEQNLPAALYDQAVALDRAGKSEAAMAPLAKLMETAPARHPLRQTADLVLALKTKLYRRAE